MTCPTPRWSHAAWRRLGRDPRSATAGKRQWPPATAMRRSTCRCWPWSLDWWRANLKQLRLALPGRGQYRHPRRQVLGYKSYPAHQAGRALQRRPQRPQVHEGADLPAPGRGSQQGLQRRWRSRISRVEGMEGHARACDWRLRKYFPDEELVLRGLQPAALRLTFEGDRPVKRVFGEALSPSRSQSPKPQSRAAVAVMRGGRLAPLQHSGGRRPPKTALLEKEFADLYGRALCTWPALRAAMRLQVALRSAGPGAGCDPVLCNAFTLSPVPGAVSQRGGTPGAGSRSARTTRLILADLDRKSGSAAGPRFTCCSPTCAATSPTWRRCWTSADRRATSRSSRTAPTPWAPAGRAVTERHLRRGAACFSAPRPTSI